MNNQNIQIGKVLKTHGTNGNLRVFIESLFIKEALKSKHFFINQLPYFVESIQKSGEQEIILKLEEVDSREVAQNLCGFEVLMDSQQVKKWKKQITDETLIHFTIYNQTQKIGKVLDILEMPQQIMLVTSIQKKEVLIPLNEDFLVEINPDEQKIVLNLPENYFEIFLG
ncbi:MAG: ribosome maturation factor RimM [Chitinophagales bacterium]